MEKKEQKSPHGWFIILLIVFTMCVFLFVMVCTGQESTSVPHKPKRITTSAPFFFSTTPPPTAVKIVREGNVLHRNDKIDLVKGSMKKHFHSLPDVVKTADDNKTDAEKAVYSPKTVSLSLHGYEISKFSVGKSFYVYDCQTSITPSSLMVTILMELPEISVEFKDHPEYSMCCPTINPYIHVVELVYSWGYKKDTMETNDYMTLSGIKICMVPWEDNLYRKAHEQVKNSPLYNVNVPTPLNLKKEELQDFLMKSGVLNQIAMVFNPPVSLMSAQNNTPI